MNAKKPPLKPNAFSRTVASGLRRADVQARKVARMHGTPVYGSKNGKIVALKP